MRENKDIDKIYEESWSIQILLQINTHVASTLNAEKKEVMFSLISIIP